MDRVFKLKGYEYGRYIDVKEIAAVGEPKETMAFEVIMKNGQTFYGYPEQFDSLFQMWYDYIIAEEGGDVE